DHAARAPRVLRPRGAPDRRAALGPGRLPLPAAVRRLPSADLRPARARRVKRVRHRPAPAVERGHRPADHCDSAAMSPLVASTRPASALTDLISFGGADGWVWERARMGFAGRGVALRIPIPSLGQAASIVAAALESIEVD